MAFTQDPSAVLDYTVDWSAWLPTSDTIASATWAVESITPPLQLSITTSNIGGTLAAAAYYWVVTAIDKSGETTPSNEVSYTWAQSQGSAVLSWTPLPTATGYKVYRGSTTGGESVLVTTLTNGAINTYTDTGSAGTAGKPPTSNTAALAMSVSTTPASSNTTTTATAFLQGGTANVSYVATCHITTAQERQASRGIIIRVEETVD